MSYIGSTPANKIVTSSDMEDGVVSTDKLAANAVTTAKITDGTIAEADIANDAVTADKIANAVNSAIAANTAKTTNATHSGEVTGSGALTIADNVVDEANLKVSNSPTNGYFLAAQSGNTGGLTWQEVSAGGITEADMHRLTTDFSGNVAPISSNWERCDENTFAKIGTGITNSSGTWSFGATGLYEVSFTLAANRADGAQYVRADIYATHNNSTYVLRSVGWSNIADHAGTIYTHCNTSIFLNVDNTTNVKFKLGVSSNTSNATTLGNTDENTTFVTAIRLGDAQ